MDGSPDFTVGRPLPSKLATFSHQGSGPPSNTWFLGPTRDHNPNDIWIGLAGFAGLMIVNHRYTDHATLSVTIGCIYLVQQCSLTSDDKRSTESTVDILRLCL